MKAITTNLYKWLMIFGLYGLLINPSFAKTVSVQTDRQQVEMGDIIKLMVETDFQIQGNRLDLTVLEDQFEILSRQQSNQIQLINGDFSYFTRWQINLMPKQVGNLMIPPITIDGSSSKAYPILVKPAKYQSGAEPFFLESKVDLTEVFVQQQLIYTLRFYHQGSLINGNVRPPQFADAQVEVLKEQSVFGKNINGQSYTVYEWQYALFPQSSGELKIPSPIFTGLLHLKGRQKGIQSRADAITITVLPAIAGQYQQWLPAKSVNLTAKWLTKPTDIKIGDSLSREITLTVKGLKATQLPPIQSQSRDGFKVYTDNEKQQQHITVDGITTVKTIQQAIVANKAGKITLPPLQISWWNTESQHMQTAVLPAESFNVANTATAKPTVNQPAQTAVAAANQKADTLQPVNTFSSFWWILTVVLFILLTVTAFMLWQSKQQLKQLTNQNRQQNHQAKQQQLRTQQFNQAWANQSAEQFYQTLLKNLRQQAKLETFQQLADKSLANNIKKLEQHLFADKELPAELLKTITEQWQQYMQQQSKGDTDLPAHDLQPLYKSH